MIGSLISSPIVLLLCVVQQRLHGLTLSLYVQIVLPHSLYVTIRDVDSCSCWWWMHMHFKFYVVVDPYNILVVIIFKICTKCPPPRSLCSFRRRKFLSNLISRVCLLLDEGEIHLVPFPNLHSSTACQSMTTHPPVQLAPRVFLFLKNASFDNNPSRLRIDCYSFNTIDPINRLMLGHKYLATGHVTHPLDMHLTIIQ